MKCINCAHIDLQHNKIASNAGYAYCKEKKEGGMTLGYERNCESFEMASGDKLISRTAWIDNRSALANKAV